MQSDISGAATWALSGGDSREVFPGAKVVSNRNIVFLFLKMFIQPKRHIENLDLFFIQAFYGTLWVSKQRSYMHRASLKRVTNLKKCEN